MNWWRLGIGLSVFAVGLCFLVETRWAMRRGTRPVQQVALIAPLSVGTVALIGGVGLLMTAAFSR